MVNFYFLFTLLPKQSNRQGGGSGAPWCSAATDFVICDGSVVLVGFKPYMKDQLVSFSALTLLVWSYDL